MNERPDGEPAAELDFDPETGLIPAVVQDVRDGQVRVLAYMNRRSLERTRRTGRVTFFSRSRDELWEKGATSGNWLEARSIEVDCDGDALLVRALPHGPTCHTGRESCFDAGRIWGREGEPKVSRDAGDRGSRNGVPRLTGTLAHLQEVVADRDRERPDGSYTAGLLGGGVQRTARKFAEEATELALSAVAGERVKRQVEESADLLYHLLVLWRALGLDPDGIARELDRRHRPDSDTGDREVEEEEL